MHPQCNKFVESKKRELLKYNLKNHWKNEMRHEFFFNTKSNRQRNLKKNKPLIVIDVRF